MLLLFYAGGGAVEEEAVTGGWLSPSQIKNLTRIADEAAKPKDRSISAKRRAERLSELELLYDQVNGLLPNVEEVSDIVRPFSASSDLPLPPTQAIDWPALLQDMTAVSALSEALLVREREEEAKMLLLIA